MRKFPSLVCSSVDNYRSAKHVPAVEPTFPDAVLREIDVVALLEDTPAEHECTGAPLVLPRGRVGTVVIVFNPEVGPFPGYMVEFCDRDGQPVAMPILPAEKLLKLFFHGTGFQCQGIHDDGA